MFFNIFKLQTQTDLLSHIRAYDTYVFSFYIFRSLAISVHGYTRRFSSHTGQSDFQRHQITCLLLMNAGIHNRMYINVVFLFFIKRIEVTKNLVVTTCYISRKLHLLYHFRVNMTSRAPILRKHRSKPRNETNLHVPPIILRSSS